MKIPQDLIQKLRDLLESYQSGIHQYYKMINMTGFSPLTEERAERDTKNFKAFLYEVYQRGREEGMSIVCEDHRKEPCYKCLDLKHGKWRDAVDKNDPAWTHMRDIPDKYKIINSKEGENK